MDDWFVFIVLILSATLRVATPLILCALGALFCERSGLIDIGLEVGYTSPSHFAQIFRRVVGVTPTAFRSSL